MEVVYCLTQQLKIIFAGCLIVSIVTTQESYGHEPTDKEPTVDAKSDTKLAPSSSSVFPLLRIVQNKANDSPCIWKAVRNTTFLLESNSAGSSFHFDQMVFGPMDDLKPGQKRLVRFLLESEGDRVAVTFLGQRSLPTMLFLNDQRLILKENAKWELNKSGKWAFIVDREHVADYLDASATPAGVSGFIRFELSSFMKGIFGSEIPRAQWNAVSRTLVLRKSNGTQASLRFRSPSDSLRYGTPLGEVYVRASNGAIVCLRAFQNTRNTRTRLTLSKAFDLAKKLDAREPLDGQAVQKTVGVLDSNEKCDAAEELWSGITTYKKIDYLNAVKKQRDGVGSLDLREQMCVLLLFDKINQTRKDRKLRLEFDRIILDAVAAQLHLMVFEIDKHLPRDCTFPDDPVMIYREIEAEFGPRFSNEFYTVGQNLLESPAASTEQQLSMCDALGDWGYLPSLANGYPFFNTMKNPLQDAILRSRWQWGCTPAHTKACLDALKDAAPNSATEFVVVETLVRLNEVARVPPEKTARWYKKYIVNGSGGMRRQSVSLLSLQPSGRDFLLNRLRKESDSKEIRECVARNLQYRVNSTLKTKRFDFMTKKDCQEILSVVQRVLNNRGLEK